MVKPKAWYVVTYDQITTCWIDTLACRNMEPSKLIPFHITSPPCNLQQQGSATKMRIRVNLFPEKPLFSKHWSIYNPTPHPQNVPDKYKWVKSHTNKKPWKTIDDLIHQKLVTEEIYNVWSDRLAQMEWEIGSPTFPDLKVSPQEKWSVYSDHTQSRKVVGNLGHELQSLLSFSPTSSYICSKHNFNKSALDKVNIFALGQYIKSLNIHWRATTVKLIHGWIPTFASLCCQGHESSPICPRCSLAI